MIRGIIDSVVEGAIKRLTISGMAGETISDREYFQHYGFTSRPLAGAEGIMIREGNHFVLIASDDRRYRIEIEDGEVALYTDEGDLVHFKRGRNIEIETDTLLIKAFTKMRIESPLLECTGEIIDRTDNDGRTMEEMREVYNGHVHPENDNGGPTDTPNQEM